MVAAFEEKNMCVMSETDYGSSEGNTYVVMQGEVIRCHQSRVNPDFWVEDELKG